MQIIITIKNKEEAENIKAVGANDLLKHFLPMAFIHADEVKVSEITEENQKLRASGEEYKHYSDVARK